MHFLKEDLNNLKQLDRKKVVKNTDMDQTIEYVKKIQLEQPGFFYTMRIDKDNIVKKFVLDKCQGEIELFTIW